MSNALAIAAVTTTLRDRISRGAGAGVNVTSAPPDRARAGAAGAGAQINLFMYQITPNPSLRNMDFNAPGAPAPFPNGEARSVPPLALNLHYLVTAYGDADSETDAHRLLGLTMSAINDHPLLELDEIRDATAASLGDSDLDRQIERVRITMMPLTTDDYYKLWSGFQSPYRTSIAYEARVVLIDTQLPRRNVLPVLTIGPSNRGVDVRASPGPNLDEVRCMSGPAQPLPGVRPMALPAARLGDHIVLIGTNLVGNVTLARFTPLPPVGAIPSSPQPASQIIDRPAESSARGLTVDLVPDNPATGEPWVAGVYNVQLIQTRGILKPITSNAVPMRLAPRLTKKPTPSGSAAAGTIAYTVSFTPAIRPEQRVTLVVGAFSSDAPLKPPRPPKVRNLSFDFPDAVATPAGQQPEEWVVRLRVDGVDSIPIDPTNSAIQFDPDQQAVIPQ